MRLCAAFVPVRLRLLSTRQRLCKPEVTGVDPGTLHRSTERFVQRKRPVTGLASSLTRDAHRIKRLPYEVPAEVIYSNRRARQAASYAMIPPAWIIAVRPPN
jgi:hypothetical protein